MIRERLLFLVYGDYYTLVPHGIIRKEILGDWEYFYIFQRKKML